MFKDRMAGHFALLSKYMRKHKDSSSLVKHLAQKDHWPELAQGEITTPKQLRAKLIFNVVYQGNPISAVRSFGTNRCKICMKEQIEILKHSFDPTVKLMNSRLEIHSSYLHKPEFRRFSDIFYTYKNIYIN
jgi:hypothetical protein